MIEHQWAVRTARRTYSEPQYSTPGPGYRGALGGAR